VRPAIIRALVPAAILLTLTAGCGASGRQPGADATPSLATPPALLPLPTPSATPSFSGPELPNGECPYLTTAQIQAALRQHLHHLAGCVYTFANGTGSFGITSQTYSSLGWTRICTREALGQARGLFPGRGFRIMTIPGLGSQALLLILPQSGAQAIFVRGTQVLAVFVLWPPAETRPQIAVTLLREAVKNFDRYSAPVSVGCS
jgi:hypothetical protein